MASGFRDYTPDVIKRLDAAAARAMKAVLMMTEGEAKKNATGGGKNLNVRTGRLRSSITHDMQGKGLSIRGRVGTPVIYGRIHELGGTITPKKGPFLIFEIDGQTVAARSVRIPARPYLRPAVTGKSAQLRSRFAQEMRKA